MSKTFKGRVVVKGNCTGEALVSHAGFNTLASLKTCGSFFNKKGIINDQNNPDVYNKIIKDKILCLPETIGSTTGGMVIYSVCELGCGPKAMLFSKPADPLAIAGGCLVANWSSYGLVMIDSLGDEFLKAVKTGQTITVKEDGSVIVD